MPGCTGPGDAWTQTLVYERADKHAECEAGLAPTARLFAALAANDSGKEARHLGVLCSNPTRLEWADATRPKVQNQP